MTIREELEREWKKERDPGVAVVLRDLYLERGLEAGTPDDSTDAKTEFAYLKREVELDVRRESMELVAGEFGNFETEPWPIQSLSMEVPPAPHVEILVDSLNQGPEDFGQALISVSVPAEHAARITGVKHRTNRGDPTAPPGSYANNPVWRTWSSGYPFPVDEVAVVRQAVEKVGDQQTPWVGTEGELFYPDGQPHELWLYMEYAPEYLHRQLERAHGYDAQFVTLYTDGGGFQSGPDAAFATRDPTPDLYQLVHEAAHSAETECPFRGSEEGDLTHVEDTYFGEHPNKSCRYCEAEIGEEHGYIYVGEGGEYVYMKVPEREDESED